MIDLKSMTPEELAAWFREQGEPAFRAKQVFQWLYRGAVSFDEMTDLPKVLRQKLEEHCFLTAPRWPESRSLPRMAPSNTCGGCQTETVSRQF